MRPSFAEANMFGMKIGRAEEIAKKFDARYGTSSNTEEVMEKFRCAKNNARRVAKELEVSYLEFLEFLLFWCMYQLSHQ